MVTRADGTRRARRVTWVGLVALLGSVSACHLPPEGTHAAVEGFTVDLALDGLTYPTNLEFAPDGRVFVAEKGGTVVAFDSLDDDSLTVVTDLGGDIHNYEDRGLLGLEVDPAFPTRPYLYVLYTLDPGDSWNDACPNPPGTFDDGCVVDARLSRLTVDGASQLVGEEEVLLEDMWCAQFPSHTVGDLEFAPDGALLVTAGDGADYNSVDYGQHGGSEGSPTPANPCDDPPGGTGTALTPPTARGGALRSQTLTAPGATHTYDGTILRLDPDTGAAFPDNPLVGGDDTVDDRVVAHGFRNPYRMASRPGTGEVWVGDVGWGTWEEVNRIVDPADPLVENFGWPCYEGAEPQSTYSGVGLDACQGLYDGTIPSAVTEPYFAYRHGAVPDSGHCGTDPGASLTALAFYGGGDYPAGYDGAVFFGDYARRCIWAMPLGASGQPDPADVQTIVVGANPVDLEVGPGGDLFWVDILEGTIGRIDYVGDEVPPQAHLHADPDNGPVPLAVQFDGTESSAGAGVPGAVTYAWDLDGDGGYDDSTAATPSRTYTEAGDVTVGLRVTNANGLSDTAETVVHAGNSRPQPVIETPVAGILWDAESELNLTGSATDAEDGTVAGTAFDWQVDLHHCSTPTDCHVHPLQTITGQSSATIVAPSHEYPAFLELTLTVEDSTGLTGSTTVRVDPRTVAVQFTTEPAGLALSVGSTTATTPFTETVIAGSHLTVTASTPQTVAGTSYGFVSWSDGGDRVHEITATDPGTLTAVFAPDPGPDPGVQYVSDLPWIDATNGFGPAERDTSNGGDVAGDGGPISLRGQVFAKGVGAHAQGAISVDVPAGCTSFSALVGVDDEVGANGSVTFTVSGDGTDLVTTPVLGPADPAHPLDVDVTGVGRLTLAVGDAGDDNFWDHVDWADAQFVCSEVEPGGFTLPASLTTGDRTHSVVARDLDGDGDRDLVAAAAGADAAVVLLNTGAGFAPAVSYPTGPGTFPKHVEVGDLTGDGIGDLVTANQDSSTDQDVTVFPGLGDGTFGPATTYGACERPHQTALGDLDGDGDVDVLVACWGSAVVSVLPNDGSGTLGLPQSYPAADAPHSLVLRDFDGDTDLDAAVAAFGDNRVAVLLNAGDGTFGAPSLLWSGLGPHNLVSGDLDGDGATDLVVTAQTDSAVGVLLGQGDGTFADAVFTGVGSTPKAAAIGDLDGDGDADLVTANTHGNYPDGSDPTSLTVLLGNGTGSFAPGFTLTNDLTPFSVAVADLDGDGTDDIATANWHSDDIKVRYRR